MQRIAFLLLPLACNVSIFNEYQDRAPVRHATVGGPKTFLISIDPPADDVDVAAQLIAANADRRIDRIRMGERGGASAVGLSDFNQAVLEGNVTALANWKQNVFLAASNDNANTRGAVWAINADTLVPSELTFALRDPRFAVGVVVASDGNGMIAAVPTSDGRIVTSTTGNDVRFECADPHTDSPLAMVGGLLDADSLVRGFVIAHSAGAFALLSDTGACVSLEFPDPISGPMALRMGKLAAFVGTERDQVMICELDVVSVKGPLPMPDATDGGPPKDAETPEDGDMTDLGTSESESESESEGGGESEGEDPAPDVEEAPTYAVSATCTSISQHGDSLTFVDLFGDGVPELAIGDATAAAGTLYVYTQDGELIGSIQDPSAETGDQSGLAVSSFVFRGAEPREELAAAGQDIVALFLRTGLTQSDGTLDCDPREIAPAHLSCE